MRNAILIRVWVLFLGFGLAVGVATADIYEGLVVHWTFDEGEGTTAYDESGNDLHGSLVGDPQWVAGKINGALDFDGDGDCVETPDDSKLHLWETFTLAGWIYQTQQLTEGRLIDKCGAGTSNGPHLDQYPGQTLRSCSGACHSGATTYDLNTWYHAAITFDQGQKILYLDGEIDGQGTTSSPLAGNSLPLRVASTSSPTPSNFFVGIIDDVRVYNRALSQEEIREVMNWTGGANAGNDQRVEAGTEVTLNGAGPADAASFSWEQIIVGGEPAALQKKRRQHHPVVPVPEPGLQFGASSLQLVRVVAAER